MNHFDIHSHMLFGTDDGAETEEEMLQMMDMAYADGTRSICFTPHFQYDLYGDNREAGESAFEIAKAYAAEKYPDLCLYLANELYYHSDAVDYIESEECRTVNGGRYVLVDFSMEVRMHRVKDAVECLISHGYFPILAHIERYPEVGGKIRDIRSFIDRGCIIQINADSLTGENGLFPKLRAWKLLKENVVHLIASDAHRANFRKPLLSRAEHMVSRKYGREYAEELFFNNQQRIIENKRFSF